MDNKIRKSIPIDGLNTPISLSAQDWKDLEKVARLEDCTIETLCRKVLKTKSPSSTLEEALELAVKVYLKDL